MRQQDEEGGIVTFQPGNQFWKARSSHGPKPKFKSAEQLWTACQEYFEWAEANPLKEEKVFCHQGVVTRVEVNKMRAMTIMGLCNFLDIVENTWCEYRKRPDLAEVTTRVDQIIRDQKFTGAAVEFFNPNIIARDLGLSDKQQIRITTLEDLVSSEEDGD